jgi:hypothetical protein
MINNGLDIGLLSVLLYCTSNTLFRLKKALQLSMIIKNKPRTGDSFYQDDLYFITVNKSAYDNNIRII